MNKKVMIPLIVLGVFLVLITAVGVWAYFQYFGEDNTCVYAGQEYSNGSSFEATDGCNTCYCEDGEVACTEIGCLDEFNDENINHQQSEEESVINPLDELSYEDVVCSGWVYEDVTVMNMRIFKDPNWIVNNISVSAGTDYANLALQGDISVVGWPNIGVTKGLNITANNLNQLETYLQTSFSPDSITSTTFGVGNYSGLLMRMDGCSSDDTTCNSQMWDTEEIYFLHNGLIWNISMTDVDATGAGEVYECFVDNFELL